VREMSSDAEISVGWCCLLRFIQLPILVHLMQMNKRLYKYRRGLNIKWVSSKKSYRAQLVSIEQFSGSYLLGKN
jgi:hypothetical protein